MNFKTTYLLFAALLVFLGLLVVSLWYHGEAKRRDTDKLFPVAGGNDKDRQLKAEDVTRVTIQRKKPAGPDVVFERVDDRTWKITEPRTLRAEGNRVTSLVDSILSAQVDPDNQPDSAKKAGLDSPSRIVTLEAKDKGRTLTLAIGDVTPGEDSAIAFVQTSERGDAPAAVRKRDIEAALEPDPVGYFRNKDLLGDGPSTDIREIKVSQAKKGTVHLRKEKDRWVFVEPPYGDAEISTEFLGKVDAVKVDYKSAKENDFVEDNVTNLAKIDKELPKSPELHIEVERGEEGKKATKWVAVVLVGKKAGDKYYAYPVDGKGKDVVKVTASSVEPFVELLDNPASKRNKNLLALESFKTPDAIDVKNSYGLLEFRKPEGKQQWELYRDGKANPTDEPEMRTLVDGLNKKDQVVSFPDPKRKKELGLEKPDIVVQVWSDSLDKPDAKKKDAKPAFKKDVKPITELRFGNREGDNVAVERIWGKESTLVMVPASLLDQVRKRPLAYYDKSVPPFNPGMTADSDVTRLALVRGSEEVEITREKAGAPWKFTKPASMKGRTASDALVRDVLNDLNRPVVKEVVAEKASADDLARSYGLAKPAYRAVVTTTKDKKDTKHEFDFGKEVSGKGYYARLAGKDTIYVVDARVVDDMKKELRDTTVLSFDPDKVVALKITGWKKVLGSVAARTFEHKDGKYTSKDYQDLDATKVNDLVAGLSHLQAERFVPSGKGLKLPEDALQVEVTLSDKKVLELTVGAAEGSYYYATSNQLKGETFLVGKDLFEKVRQAPGYFSK